MKIEEYENKIKNLVEVNKPFLFNIMFPEDTVSQGLDLNNVSLVLLLAVYKPFVEHISETRKKLKLSTLKLPFLTEDQCLEEINKNFNNDEIIALEKEIYRTIDLFKLDDSWFSCIKTLLVTNLFFIPHYAAVGLHEPATDSMSVLGYPAIYFFRKVTKTELIEWIRDNFIALDKFQSVLPERNVHKINQKTLFSGYQTFIQRNIHNLKSWSEIRNKRDALLANGLDTPETELEIKDNYKSFLKKFYDFTQNIIN